MAATGNEVKRCIPGARVSRGPDWKWADSDGGRGRCGVLITAGSPGWVKVQWERGGANSYRIGADGKFDLVFVDAAMARDPGPRTPQHPIVELVDAVVRGDLRYVNWAVDFLIIKHLDINAATRDHSATKEYWRTAYHALVFECKAAIETRVEIAKRLVDGDCRPEMPDSLGRSALHHPCPAALMKIMFTTEPLPYLECANCGRPPLHDHITHRNLEECKLLIENNANLTNVDGEGNTPLMLAVRHGMVELMEFLLKDKQAVKEQIDNKNKHGETALSITTADIPGLTRNCKRLIRRCLGSPDTADEFTIQLCECALRLNADRVRSLLTKDVDVNARVDVIVDAMPALSWAVADPSRLCNDHRYGAEYRENLVAIVRMLLDHKADPNIPSKIDGWCPLHLVRLPAAAKLLVEAKAYVNISMPDGTRPLMLAACAGNTEVVQILLDAGADPRKPRKDGKVVLDLDFNANTPTNPNFDDEFDLEEDTVCHADFVECKRLIQIKNEALAAACLPDCDSDSPTSTTRTLTDIQDKPQTQTQTQGEGQQQTQTQAQTPTQFERKSPLVRHNFARALYQQEMSSEFMTALSAASVEATAAAMASNRTKKPQLHAPRTPFSLAYLHAEGHAVRVASLQAAADRALAVLPCISLPVFPIPAYCLPPKPQREPFPEFETETDAFPQSVGEKVYLHTEPPSSVVKYPIPPGPPAPPRPPPPTPLVTVVAAPAPAPAVTPTASVPAKPAAPSTAQKPATATTTTATANKTTPTSTPAGSPAPSPTTTATNTPNWSAYPYVNRGRMNIPPPSPRVQYQMDLGMRHGRHRTLPFIPRPDPHAPQQPTTPHTPFVPTPVGKDNKTGKVAYLDHDGKPYSRENPEMNFDENGYRTLPTLSLEDLQTILSQFERIPEKAALDEKVRTRYARYLIAIDIKKRWLKEEEEIEREEREADERLEREEREREEKEEKERVEAERAARQQALASSTSTAGTVFPPASLPASFVAGVPAKQPALTVQTQTTPTHTPPASPAPSPQKSAITIAPELVASAAKKQRPRIGLDLAYAIALTGKPKPVKDHLWPDDLTPEKKEKKPGFFRRLFAIANKARKG